MVSGTVLVTGGAGFIGSRIVDSLIETGSRVRVLDSLHPLAHRGRPSYINPDAEYIWGDLRDHDAVARAVVGVDAVSHQGSMVGLGSDPTDVDAYVDHNDNGTAVLLRGLYDSGFTGRIVLAGSMVVYGEGRYRCREHGVVGAPPRRRSDLVAGHFEPGCPHCQAGLAPEPVPESQTPDPRNFYAATKLHQEHLCSAWARETSNQSVALRYHNVYGPRMPRDTPYAGVASIFRSALEAGRAPRVFEDGGQLRDFVHVGDIARANLLALGSERPIEGAFNIGSGQRRPISELASELAGTIGGPQPLISGEYRLGDVRHVFASISKAESILGYSPTHGFADGVREFATAELRAPAAD